MSSAEATSAPVGLSLFQLLLGADEVQQRDRTAGRHQRRIRWIVNGDLIAPNWRDVQAGTALEPKDAGD